MLSTNHVLKLHQFYTRITPGNNIAPLPRGYFLKVQNIIHLLNLTILLKLFGFYFYWIENFRVGLGCHLAGSPRI